MQLLRRTRALSRRRVAIIGLDCAEPSLVFDQFQHELPTLNALRQRGLYGRLESVVPAITVPAWSCMMSGRDPGALGIYGFRNRRDFTYNGLGISDGRSVRLPRLWDLLSRYGKRSLILNVPGTYPPSPINGSMVGCFLTPNAQAEYTYPESLKTELTRVMGREYPFDVREFRTDDKQWLLNQVYDLTAAHFKAARHLSATQDWDLFSFVEIGLDRLHHALWAHHDSGHRNHDPSSPFVHAIRDYYRMLDSEIARLISTFDDETIVFVVSDHGAQRMEGGICFNEWLIREGYLVLKSAPDTTRGVVKFDQLDVDWSRTTAWGEGGYYGRLFLNIRGREPEGILPPEAAEVVLAEISARLENLGDEHGNPIGTRCFRPHDLYPAVNGIAPDMLVYFGNLSWRSLGTVGWGRIHVYENDTGPDDANHAQHGMILYADPLHDYGGQILEGAHLLQIAPTVLRLLGIPVPSELQMPPIHQIES